MLRQNQEMFFQFPSGSDERILHPGKVTHFNDGVFSAQVADASLSFEPEQELFVFYELNQEFVQQAVRVATVLSDENSLTVAFTTSSDPVSAEGRQCYRVSTVIAGLKATVDGEQDIPLCDVSATGFSVISTREHSRGVVVSATLSFEGKSYTGKAVIQSVKEVAPGRFRCGFHVAGNSRDSKELAKALPVISMGIQRDQLKRMSGAA